MKIHIFQCCKHDTMKHNVAVVTFHFNLLLRIKNWRKTHKRVYCFTLCFVHNITNKIQFYSISGSCTNL